MELDLATAESRERRRAALKKLYIEDAARWEADLNRMGLTMASLLHE
jgi:hypothetical protein